MSGRVRSCSSHERSALESRWELAPAVPLAPLAPAAPANSAAAPTPPPESTWSPALVPGTVASSLRADGRWSLDAPARRFDAEEWWYRTRFGAAPAAVGERLVLGFEGLATLAEVWLNGSPLIDSRNMFLEQQCDVTALLQTDNELLIRFAAVDPWLAPRRPRPRWRTPMVAHQQLRWLRTSLLGRTPGWSPPAAPLGPWRPVWLERRRLLEIGEQRLQATVAPGGGRVSVRMAVSPLPGVVLEATRLIVTRGEQRSAAPLSVESGVLQGDVHVPQVELWWPHTHGASPLYRVTLEADLVAGGNARQIQVDLGSVGFRTLRLEREAGRFGLRVNGVEIFCRGASWTPLDCVSLQAGARDYALALDQVRAAGMNMLRVAGPLVYETDEFLERCDAAGILVWQDFMFANMDYPTDDPAFAASVLAEVRQQLARWQAHPALALLCGNSEGAQQAAMSGAGRDAWAPPFFESRLAALAHEACADVPYCPSSTHGGALPFQPDVGVTSYYGVGAYLLPLADARRSNVRFASECLAFANVPDSATLAALGGDTALRSHHPRWKERVPRDMGAGWDFDDVRDHYLERLYRVRPAELRYADHDRYLELSRCASGEVMAATFAEWRRVGSACQGGLIWFLKDLWPGAGWGVIDSTGLPKAAYYYLKRALQPQAVFFSDEQTNGLMIHIANDAPTVLRARLELRQFRHSQPVGAVAERLVEVEPASRCGVWATDLYEGFVDLSHTYQFGPSAFDLLHATLSLPDGAPRAEAFYFPTGVPNAPGSDVGLSASAARLTDDRVEVAIHCHNFAQAVHVEMPGCVADDQFFHMAPQSRRTLTVTRGAACESASFEGWVHALNAARPCRIAQPS